MGFSFSATSGDISGPQAGRPAELLKAAVAALVSSLCEVRADLVILELCTWDGHSRAVRPVTLVLMMAGVWEVGFSQRCRESPWAEEQAVLIDAASSAILFIRSSSLWHLYSFLCFGGQNHTFDNLLFTEPEVKS